MTAQDSGDIFLRIAELQALKLGQELKRVRLEIDGLKKENKPAQPILVIDRANPAAMRYLKLIRFEALRFLQQNKAAKTVRLAHYFSWLTEVRGVEFKKARLRIEHKYAAQRASVYDAIKHYRAQRYFAAKGMKSSDHRSIAKPNTRKKEKE